jgi:hypothetical protein
MSEIGRLYVAALGQPDLPPSRGVFLACFATYPHKARFLEIASIA